MHLIQLLLPLYDNDGQALPKSLFAEVRDELMQQFGGLTAHTRAPVNGLWLEDDNAAVRDDLIIYEVLAPELNRSWWSDYRTSLETRFRQEQVLIQAHPVERL
ncbi:MULTISPECIES: hypothetical protein [Pseudomonadaceae]|uniref:hypothetical protein n=1 Tax=Pseudomonadaceae TaxID=135621 RepID=UPI00103F3A07|nr:MULTISPECIES: hypothetical protein [Pseudomonadaceae]MBA1279615.1 hypothetical protein [Stutzerimonas stutzeri]TCD19118.1 hypothetical protein E0D86_19070 [Pseudomonas sp. IC_126]